MRNNWTGAERQHDRFETYSKQCSKVTLRRSSDTLPIPQSDERTMKDEELNQYHSLISQDLPKILQNLDSPDVSIQIDAITKMKDSFKTEKLVDVLMHRNILEKLTTLFLSAHSSQSEPNKQHHTIEIEILTLLSNFCLTFN